MRKGAVITAAGMSTRMGEFKQLMKLGEFSFIERVVLKLEQAQVDDIVIVTGYRADDIRKELSEHNLIFAHNSDFETSQMLDSIKLGLAALNGKVDRIAISPCDVVAFEVDTVKKIFEADGEIIIPSYNRKSGHPICIDSSLVPDIIKYQGEDGLRGAIKSMGIIPVRLEVNDEGILWDADTMADYERLKIKSQNDKITDWGYIKR